MNILIVIGTRPEAVKLVPVILALLESDAFRPIVVSTGQHHQMVREVLALAGIEPDFNLRVGATRSQLNDRLRETVGRFEDLCRQEFAADGTIRPAGGGENGEHPMSVMVQGDTTSAMSAALAAFHLRMPVVHVEAGLRSGDSLIPFPEEMNRQLITRTASLHLAPTRRSRENLIREDVPAEQILVTGNTGIDALKWAPTVQADITEPELRKLYHSDRRLVLITAHRRENWDSGINGIAFGVRRLAAENPEISFVVPQHPNPLIRQKWAALSEAENVFLTEPAPYAEFAKLLARSFFVITDSGGIQEEAPSLGKPVLVARESTERTEGVEAGTLLLTGPDSDMIFKEGMKLITDERVYREMSQARNPYGDGNASGRIVAALESLYEGTALPEPFGAEDPLGTPAEMAEYSVPEDPRPGLAPGLLSGSARGPRTNRPADELRVHPSEITESEPAS